MHLKEDVGDYYLKELFKESSKINELFLGAIVTCVKEGCWNLELRDPFQG